MVNNNYLIQLENISQSFSTTNDTIQVLENISLTINQGDFVCVVGPSGCGKSTLLKMIAGYLKPTEGQVLMSGQTITGPSAQRGVVFQNPTLYPWLTVTENICYGPKVLKKDKHLTQKKCVEFLTNMSLEKFANAYPFELSGGMKQRVAIARALMNQPDVLLMDEPFSALDAITRSTMQQLIKKLWLDTHQTIFLITHDIEEALLLGTKIVVLSKNPGKIILEKIFDYQMEKKPLTQWNKEKKEKFQQDKQMILSEITTL
ncbi:hypothetical protein CBF34_07415 [Vagococcus penaei]|uniref:Uncharacterized protein n=1 Tax=Vagococcus penaei TaxID=633807 RepID=A0A1Q2D379_9ENTE|nr:ABC transporter ATP-binding protein [Vagococcus penaei]AQP52805.1 hypothetical protein BW732_00280 [Vagococcus penaei]RSU01146.1 hypothetical protein CBF34_07415 [Vagococcus penaei]